MELKGSLDTMSFPELLQWLSDASKTGTLSVTNQNERKDIFLRDGVIVSAASNLDKDRFGVLIVRENYCSQEELLLLLEEGKKSGKMLGKVCVEKGILTENQVKDMLQKQGSKIIESLFHRRDGDFFFKEGDLPDQDLVNISIITHQLFFDSAGKRKDWMRIHDVLGSLDTVLVSAPDPPDSVTTLSDFEKQLFALCDGNASILDLCANLDRSDFDICNTLTRLVTDRWLVRREDLQPPEDKALNENLWQASILIDQKRFVQAVRILKETSALHPGNDKIKAQLQKCLAALDEDIQKTLQPETITPQINSKYDTAQLQMLKLTAQDWFVYSRINGTTTLKDLYRISGLGKMETKRTLYVLLKNGAISLGSHAGDSPAPPFQSQSTAQSAPPRKPAADSRTRAKQPASKPLSSTGEFSVPERFLTPRSPSDMDLGTAELPTMDELNTIYTSFLRQNNYQILNVSRDASQTQIRESFVKLTRKYHSDSYFSDMQLNKLDEELNERLIDLFSIVNHAYSVLSNPVSRKRYDEELWANERAGFSNEDILSSILDAKPLEKTSTILVTRPRKPAPSTSGSAAAKTPKSPERDTGKTDRKPVVPPAAPPRAKPAGKQEAKMEDPEELATVDMSFVMDDEESSSGPKWSVLLEKGKKLYESNDLKQAVDVLTQSVKNNAKNAETYYYLALVYYKLGKNHFAAAEENIKRALIIHPENALYYALLAHICYSAGKQEEAEKYLKTSLAWNPDLVEAKRLKKKIKEDSEKGFFKKFLKKKKN